MSYDRRILDTLGGGLFGAACVYFIGIALPPIVLLSMIVAGVGMIITKRKQQDGGFL